MITPRQNIATEIIRVATEHPTMDKDQVCQVVSDRLPGVLPEHVEAVLCDAQEPTHG